MLGFKERFQHIRSDLKVLKRRLTLPASLRKFFQEQITEKRARENIQRALESREERFLDLIRTQVYEVPTSPYLSLLRYARCDFSDLRRHVLQHGLEKTLEQLAKEGVYLTADEFKGKKEVVRGTYALRVYPSHLEFRHRQPGFLIQSSGTNNQPVRSLSSIEWLAKRASATCIFFSAHNLFSYSHAMYDAILPGGGGLNNLLIYAKLGKVTERWFARKIPISSHLERSYHYFNTYLIILAGKYFGPGFPKPDFLDIGGVDRIVQWVLEKNRAGIPCCITTPASNATRIARTAWDMGASLEGTKFVVSGEPFTKSKSQWIERVGASATSRYAFGGGINIGLGCAKPVQIDEVHVNQHLLAVIPCPSNITENGRPIHPLLCTTIDSSAPRLFLNVQNGDYARMEHRNCGCELGNVGLDLHLYRIRSFEKFTSEGMNYFYADLFDFLEKSIPEEFGGGPGDYQLVEEEDDTGQTQLTLLVHPEVGKLDQARLLQRLHNALARGSRGNRFMTRVWEDAGSIRIRRAAPHASPRGKILPLHMNH